jgi:hypothetical protein
MRQRWGRRSKRSGCAALANRYTVTVVVEEEEEEQQQIPSSWWWPVWEAELEEAEEDEPKSSPLCIRYNCNQMLLLLLGKRRKRGWWW